MTSALPFKSREFTPNSTTSDKNTILDRLLHHSNIINIVGRSYRTKDIIDEEN